MADALAEIERLRAEVADLGRRYADSESNLAACGYALKTVRSALAALRKRVEEAPVEEVVYYAFDNGYYEGFHIEMDECDSRKKFRLLLEDEG